jgi:hypothetical protein
LANAIDPNLDRWLTRDPIGPVNSSNLYQYVFNNPFVYRDPDGQFAFVIPLLIWGAEFVLPTLSVCITPIVYGAVIGTVAEVPHFFVPKKRKNI